MTRTKRRIPFLALLALGLATLAAYAVAAILQDRGNNGPPVAQVISVEASSAIDVTDERKVVGFGSDGFVGRVVRQLGAQTIPDTAPGPDTPQTRFAVEVLSGIKGRPGRTVTVTQMGGYDKEQEALVLIEGDALLQPGGTYVFSTRKDQKAGVYHIVAPGFGKVRARDARHRAALVEKYAKAYQSQILYSPANAQVTR